MWVSPLSPVLHTLDDFYGDVVQQLREWQPAAPKLQSPEQSKPETDSITPTSNAPKEPVGQDGSKTNDASREDHEPISTAEDLENDVNDSSASSSS